jgi:predicted DNA-binding transcriptional regulator AlpA
MKEQEQQNPAAPRLRRILRMRDLPPYVGLHKTQIGELVKAGQFPRPVPLSDTGIAVGWLEDDIISWQDARISKRVVVAQDEAKTKKARR